MRRKILVILAISIVLFGMTDSVSAWSWYITKPYGYGSSSAFYGSSSYDLTNGYCYAKCAIGSGYAQAAAGIGPEDMDFFLGCDTDVTITVDVTLTAYLDVIPVWAVPPSYAQVCVNVYLVNKDTAPDRVLDSETAWTYVIISAIGRQSYSFSNYHITETVTLNPDNLMDIYYEWTVVVELFVCCYTTLGQARVALSSTSTTSPARLRVNSISVTT